MSKSWWPHGLQHASLPCLSPTPKSYSNSCSSSWWCPPTNLSSVVPISCLQSSSIRVFSSESVLCIRWPKYWSFSFSISPSNEYPGLISFRIDVFNTLAIQGTLKSLLQHHNIKASVPQHSAFFMAHFSHLYMTTGKVITLIIQIFVGKVMSLFFNMMSRIVIVFLPKSKCLLIA